TDEAVFGQLGAYPRALSVTAVLIGGMGLMPGLPAVPFLSLAIGLGAIAYFIPLQRRKAANAVAAAEKHVADTKAEEDKQSIKQSLKTAEIELLIGKQLSTRLLTSHQELAFRMSKMRKK